MKKLAKNTTYIVVIHKAADSFNTYAKVVNAYKITNGQRKYFDVKGERTDLFTDENQIAREFLISKGFDVPTYLSDAQNLVVFSTTVKYKQL